MLRLLRSAALNYCEGRVEIAEQDALAKIGADTAENGPKFDKQVRRRMNTKYMNNITSKL